MKKIIAVLTLLFVAGLAPAATAQITSAGVNGDWTDAATWDGGVVPTSVDDVVIAAGDTVIVREYTAECRDLSFGAESAQIKMYSTSQLSVYGDFTLYSTSHCVFDEYWSTSDATIRFAGSAEQTLSGFNTSGGSTSFRDMIVDKDGGFLTTDGSGMRLGIQNSLEIVSGLFELAEGDDIEGRWATSGNFTGNNLPDIVVQAEGEFDMVDGSGVHHIRSDYDDGTHVPIGTLTIYGAASFRDVSTYCVNLSGVDVEAGGKLVTSTGMGGNEFVCGPLHIKPDGELEHYTTADCWGATAVVTLDEGGVFDTKASTTIFPTSFTNNGTVRYSRDATTDQTITDMDYKRLEISQDSDNLKVWTLAADRAIADTLRVNYSANLQLLADDARVLTVGSLLWLTSGELDNGDADVALTIPDGATVRRAAGDLVAAPTFAGVADLVYSSLSVQVTTGPEMPTAAGVIDDFTISGDQGVVLSQDIEIGGVCTTEASDLITGPYTVTLADGASLVESPGATILGTATTTRTVAQSVNETFGGLGLEILAAGAAPGATTVVRTTGATVDKDASDGIERFFDVVPTLNAGLDATVVFHYDESELAGLDENFLAVYESVGGGWSACASVTDPQNDAVTAAGFDTLSGLTLSTQGAVAAMLDIVDIVARRGAVDLSWRTFDTVAVEDYRITRFDGNDASTSLANRVIAEDDLSYSFTDEDCRPGETYRYRVEVASTSGTWILFETRDVEVPLLGAELAQNHPNPFNPSTEIAYTLAVGGHVDLAVYDVSGRLIDRLVDETQAAGTYTATWTGRDRSGRAVPSGMYFCSLVAGDEVSRVKMMLVR